MKIAWKRMVAALAALVMCLTALPVPEWSAAALAEGSWGKVTADEVKVRKRASMDEEYWFIVDADYICEVTDVVSEDGITWYKVVAEHPDSENLRTYVGYIHGDYFRMLTTDEVNKLEAQQAAKKPNVPAAEGTIGEIKSNGVNFRETEGGNALFKLDAGETVEVLTIPAQIDEEHWYKVRYNGYLGFIQAPYVRILVGGAADGEADPTETIYVKLILSSANLRLSPAGTVGAQWEKPGEILAVTGAVESKSGYQWYPVTVNGVKYYVRSDTVQVISPAETVTPTPTPSAEPEAEKVLYVKLILSSANLRLTPAGKVGAQWEKPGEMLLVTDEIVTKSGYTWYPVTYNGFPYFVRSDTVQVIEMTETLPPENTETPTPTPTPTVTAASLYVKLVLSSANLRLTPAGKVGAQWEKKGEVLAVTGTPVRQSGYIWYPVTYNGNAYFVRSDTVQEVNASGATEAPTQQPDPENTEVTAVGYVKTVLDKVNLRLKPAGTVVEQVAINRVLPMLKEAEESEGYAWYYVQVGDVKGYLRGDCVLVVNQDGSPLVTEAPTDNGVVPSAFGYIRLVEDKVNLRKTIAGKTQMQLDMGTVLPMTGYATVSGSYTWYPVVYNRVSGYVRGDCAIPCDQNGAALPTSQPTATPAPSVSKYGYVMITAAKINVRNAAGGLTIGTVPQGSVWPMTGKEETKDGYTWYPIDAGSLKGYVRGDCSFKLSAAQQESYLAGNGVPEEPKEPEATVEPQVNYIVTVLNDVNLREAATKDSKALFNIDKGVVMAYNDYKTVGGKIWYRAVYNNTNIWVLGSCVKVMTAQEYQDYLATNPESTPQPEVVKGYVITTSGGINLRNEANGSKILGRVDKGVVMAYVDTPETVRGVAWYHVKHPTLGLGYIHGDYVEQCDYQGAPLPTTGPVIGGGNEGKEEASYKTLRKGSVGEAVEKLVTELKKQGYYVGTVTNQYTTAVQEAVSAFQKAQGLKVDGIAGSETQHKLFNTVPIGTATGDLTMELYPAEKIDWFTGGIQQLWPKGTSYKVYDVYTGIVWWARRWSGGKHLDAEPLTAADTARLCKIYGVKDAQEIEELDLWEKRPLLVTIKGHTYACSLYGVPHNYPDGDTIPDNNYNGQLCIHFTNSRGHESDKISPTHTEATEYAYNHCPAGKIPYNP